MPLLERVSPKRLLLAVTTASIIPFLVVELFKQQLYVVMDVSQYLVFHNMTEFFSIMVSLSIFGLGWYAYDQNRNRHSLFLSVAFLAIGLIDMMHTLGYAGMPPLITFNDSNKPTQFWIAARFFAAVTFLFSGFIDSRSAGRLLSKAALITAVLTITIVVFVAVTFFPGYLPITFIEGQGLTPFKVYAEYTVILLLVLTFCIYWRRLSRTGHKLINYYLAAFLLCIFSELSFTLYKSAFDTYNALGHIYKIIAFGLVYKGIFVASIRKPYKELLASNDEHRISRNMLSQIMNSIPQSIFWKDRENVYLGCNRVFARQAGINNPDDIVGKSDFDLPWSREESECYRSDDQEVMARRVAKHHIIEPQSISDGSVIWIDTTKIPLVDPAGTVIGVLGVYEDITVRKQGEEELKEALLFSQQIINSAREGIIVYDCDLCYRVWNPFMEEVTGVNSADVMGKTPLEIFSFLQESGVMERLRRALDGQLTEVAEFHFQVPGTGKSGWASDSSAPLLNAKGEIIGVIGTVRDTTESRKTEEQLLQSQKMEALGQLAGGVAHDFNNMLQVIIGYSSLLRIDATAAQDEHINEILKASERAAELTSGLLSYSRKQQFKVEPSDLVILLGGVEKFLRRILGEDITLSVEKSPEPLIAVIDRTHIQQVFVNLASNARDAMHSGGILSIHMERIVMDEEFVSAHGFGAAGPYALISVSDNGRGIAKEHLQKIFEPFYTTKGVGHGTGLGLSIVYGIITQHNGFINCYSEEGIGTTFRIYLSLSNASVQHHEKAVTVNANDDKGMTILVVEDDHAVRAVTKSLLELHGYVVLEASNGKQGVDIFSKHSNEIGLVIIDAIMPELNGAETLEAIRELKPGTKALFLSGYAREIISGKMIVPDDAEFINKPVLPARLIETIRKTVRGGTVHAASGA